MLVVGRGMSTQPIETHYAGYRFRSRLEARWAVFFTHLDIGFQYEHQGYVVDGHPYLPDFLLTDCGTWVEVKGSEAELDRSLMLTAAEHLPEVTPRYEAGPRLLILGPIPELPPEGDLGWIGLDVIQGSFDSDDDEVSVMDQWWGFGAYHKNRRPWVLVNTSCATPVAFGDEDAEWLTPVCDPTEEPAAAVRSAYSAARKARFEHGEKG